MRRLSLVLLALLHASCADRTPLPTAPVSGPLLAKQGGGAASYEVGFTTYLLHDASRGDRPIPVYVWYPVAPGAITGATPEAQYPLEPFTNALPVATSSDFESYGMGRAYHQPAAAAGPFPLVLFSPGWGGAAYSDALYLGTSLARRGFVVAALTHWGDRAAPVLVPGEPLDHTSMSAWNRPRDMSFALSDLLAKNVTTGHLLQGAIASGSIYAAGWSWGGLASMVLAGGDDNGVCDFDSPGAPPEACTSTPPDPRIRGIISLDGSGWAMHFYELARVRVPVLTMGQEWSAVGDWHAREHAAFSGQPNYRVDVTRAVHQNFSNWCVAWYVWQDKGINVQPGWWDPAWGSINDDLYAWLCESPATEIMPSAEAHRLITKYVLAFLTGNQSVLTPGHALTSEPDIEFFVTEKRNPNAITEDFPGYYAYFQHQPGRGTSKATVSLAAKDPKGPRPASYGYPGKGKP
jgi:dienelactone hydrolase